MRLSRAAVVFLVILIAAFVHLAHYYPQLPETVPTNFGAGGEPNGWSSRSTYIALQIGLYVFLGLLFPGIGLLLCRVPISAINLPNRDYWLAPERRGASLRVMNEQMLWLGAATIAFIAVTNHLAIQVALEQRETLGNLFWILLLVYLAGTAAWAAWLILSFRLSPQDR